MPTGTGQRGNTAVLVRYVRGQTDGGGCSLGCQRRKKVVFLAFVEGGIAFDSTYKGTKKTREIGKKRIGIGGITCHNVP